VLAFTFVISIATGLLFSVVPALQAARASLHDALQQHARSMAGVRGRLTRDVLVVLQVAAALVLLVAAGLMLRTLANLRAIDLGFRSAHLLTMETTLPRERYDAVRRLAFYDRVLASVRALPGVERAAYVSLLPFLSQGNTAAFGIEGRPRPVGQMWDALYRVGTNDYLQTLGVQLVAGRLIDERDGADAPPVVVINETMARTYWPNASPLGHRLWFLSPDSPRRTIVGVVKDVHERGYDVAMKSGAYLPYSQTPDTWALPENLVIRVAGDPTSFAAAARRIIADADPLQPVAAVRTMDEIVDLAVVDRHQQMTLLVAFAGLALLLASVGLYGVLAYSVAQRRAEIGLRIALGATPRRVITMVVARGLSLTAIGLAAGTAAAWAVTRTMANLLYGVGATDPSTFAAVTGLVAAVAAAACAIPAVRASRVDPARILGDRT
jgi:predicted permease